MSGARACMRCHKVKPARRFPAQGTRQWVARGRELRHPGIPRVCWACLEAQAYEMDARNYRSQHTDEWKDGAGPRMRRCCSCGTAKKLTTGFDRAGRTFYRSCKVCRKAQKAAEAKLARQRPEVKAKLAAYSREKRRTDPEAKRKANEASARWREKIKRENRAEYERQLELNRMTRRLRREQAGLPVREPRVKTGREHRFDVLLPSAPLAALITRVIEQREVIAEAIGDPPFAQVASVCADLGTSDRMYRGWRDGERPNVGIGTAERLMMNADVEVSEVYSADDYPEVLAHFTGVEAEA